ncbi:MAG TPA: hypothetical protein VFV38_51940 [Ktedonobacteraceae bacterium]|nr:hypothetical protein [Ktedonobacteraceae bacterium]
MLCPTCDHPLPEGVKVCDNCESTLIIAKPHVSGVPELSRKPDAASVHAHLLYEQVLQTLADFQTKQQSDLALLRGELEGRLKTLGARPKAEGGHRLRLHINDSTMSILFIALAGLLGFVWFLYKLVNFHKEIRFDNITILASTLTAIGSLYLAYDLLGRQHGPLRWVSLFVTSGLIGAIILEPVALPVAGLGNIPDALKIFLVGIVLGSFSGILFAVPEDPRHPMIFSGKAGLVGGLLGILFWAALFRIFPPQTYAGSIWPYLLLATLFGVPSGVLLGGFHHFFRGNYRPGKPAVFSWRSSLKAFGIILVIWGIIALLVLGGSASEQTAMYSGPLVVLAVALSGAIPSGFAPYIFWWLNHFPERVLGAAGFVLTLIGALLPVIQPIVNILSALKG